MGRIYDRLVTSTPRTVLVVDDEPTLVATLKYNLEHDGYRVLTATDGGAAVAVAQSEHPDLMVLDLMLPVIDGLEVCRILRRDMKLPILMLTARSEEVDKVVGLELGADDYVTKPFAMRELLARVRALLRRSTQLDDVEKITCGNLEIDLKRREASCNGVLLEVKPKELELLIFLARNRARAFTREQLLRDVWGYEYLGDSRTVDVHMRWLRQKIEVEPAKPVRLITVRGVGYRFEG